MVAGTTAVADVLVIEDEPLVREAVQSLLQARGFAVAGAGNGREALNWLRRHQRPQLILLDLMMPVMNGWEFRRLQVRDEGLAAIPVVVFSGVGDVRAEADLIGAEDYLQKPVAPDDLAQTVSRFCVGPTG